MQQPSDEQQQQITAQLLRIIALEKTLTNEKKQLTKILKQLENNKNEYEILKEAKDLIETANFNITSNITTKWSNN